MKIPKLAFVPAIALLGVAAATVPTTPAAPFDLTPGQLGGCTPDVRPHPVPPAPTLFIEWSENVAGVDGSTFTGFTLRFVPTAEAGRSTVVDTRLGKNGNRVGAPFHGTTGAITDPIEYYPDGGTPLMTALEFEWDGTTFALRASSTINGDPLDPIPAYPTEGTFAGGGFLTAPTIEDFGYDPGSNESRARIVMDYYGVKVPVFLVG